MRAFKINLSASRDKISTWNCPFTSDDLVRRTERSFTQASCKIAYIRGRTSISLDDDQYRLQSAISESMGFVRINNPKKAFGIVYSNAVSLTTSMVLGMHLIGRGESFEDVVRILMMWMQNVDMPQHMDEMNEMIFLDRGYLGPALIEHLIDHGFELKGTHKRVKSFPFTFGQLSGDNSGRRVVEEVGAKSLYVSKKKIGNRWVYAIAYRSGRGRVATLLTNRPKLGISERFQFNDSLTFIQGLWIYREKKM